MQSPEDRPILPTTVERIQVVRSGPIGSSLRTHVVLRSALCADIVLADSAGIVAEVKGTNPICAVHTHIVRVAVCVAVMDTVGANMCCRFADFAISDFVMTDLMIADFVITDFATADSATADSVTPNLALRKQFWWSL